MDNYKNIGKLLVSNLPLQTSTDEMEAYFYQFGEVIDCVIMRNRNTSMSLGFGVVIFNDIISLINVLEKTHHSINGRPISVQVLRTKEELDFQAVGRNPAQPSRSDKNDSANRGRSEVSRIYQPPHTSGTEGILPSSSHSLDSSSGESSSEGMPQGNTLPKKKVYLGGLPPDTSKTAVRKALSRFGKIRYVNLICDKNSGRCKGFGFVGFNSGRSAKEACSLGWITISGVEVQCKRAVPRDVIPKPPSEVHISSGEYNTTRWDLDENIQGSMQTHDTQDQLKSTSLCLPSMPILTPNSSPTSASNVPDYTESPIARNESDNSKASCESSEYQLSNPDKSRNDDTIDRLEEKKKKVRDFFETIIRTHKKIGSEESLQNFLWDLLDCELKKLNSAATLKEVKDSYQSFVYIYEMTGNSYACSIPFYDNIDSDLGPPTPPATTTSQVSGSAAETDQISEGPSYSFPTVDRSPGYHPYRR